MLMFHKYDLFQKYSFILVKFRFFFLIIISHGTYGSTGTINSKTFIFNATRIIMCQFSHIFTVFKLETFDRNRQYVKKLIF